MSHCAGQRYPPPARTYYYDATAGNNANAGNSEHSPLQTLADLSARALKPGDRVLRKRGETWKAQHLTVPASGKYGRPITFGAYGSGANPVIDPTTELNDFALDSGAIWQRSDTNNVYQVFQDGTRLIYKVDKASMSQGSYAKVEGTPGTLYVWCTDDGNPNTGHVIDVVVVADNIAIDFNGKSHLVFDALDVTKANIAAYSTSVAWNADNAGHVVANIIIQNCTVSFAGIRSILIGTVSGSATGAYPKDVLIRNCIGHDDLDLSFWIGRGTRLIVEDCETYNSGADVAPNGKLYPASGALEHFPNGILVSGNGVDCIVRGNYVHDILGGMPILDELSAGLKSSRTLIEGNKIDGSADVVPAVEIEGVNTTLRNNWIICGTGAGIMLANAPTVPLIYNNTLISATGAAHSIDTASQPGAVIKNNIIVRAGATNRYVSVAAAAKTGMAMGNNLYYGASTGRWFWGPTEYTSLANWQAACGMDANSLNVDPEFVTANTDVHLQSTSDAIGAGDATLGVLTDYDGRVRGAAVDIGAFEYVA